jgi:acyl-CoA thioester hydrolase
MLIRVYYEDTDAAGVVYHANYLSFMERARTEYMRQHGCSVSELAASGTVFPVVRAELTFKAPARLDDLLRITVAPVHAGGSSFTLRQQILRDADGLLLVEALVTIACATPELKPKRIPAEIRNLLTSEVTV